MTGRLLLDTHIALWTDSDNARLRASTRTLIDNCWRNGGTIFISAVTAWEIALLLDLGRVELDVPVTVWMDRFLKRPGSEAVALHHRAAAASYQLHHFDCRDPADRLLIATAIDLDCPLVTYDERIVRFAKNHGRQYRFRVES